MPPCKEKKFKTYLIDYHYNGGQKWEIKMKAESWADAQKRLSAIKYNGKVVGEHIVDIPCLVPYGFVRRLNNRVSLFLKNLLGLWRKNQE